jgi:CRP/FNR family transcriptional regulator, cyclic AMP receptor protein
MITAPGIDARILPILAGSSFLGSLQEPTLKTLVRRGQTRRIAKGEVVCWRGDPGDSAMVILSGGVKVGNTTAEGREVGLNFLSAGDVVGEIAVLDGRERTATVTAIEDTEIFVIHRRDLLDVLMANGEAMLELIQVLCDRLRSATAIIEDSAHEMQGRLARGLLRLAQQHGAKQKDRIRINLKLSQSELGTYVGLSRPNVSRQLSQLKALGFIEVDDSVIILLDEPALIRLSENELGNSSRP